MFDAAIASAQPAVCIPPHLPESPRGRLIVVGAGKASAAMARVVEDNWQGPLSGLVVTRYGYAVPCRHIEIVEAAHPVPDAAGMRAAQRILKLVGNLHKDDLVLCLISGGGSALMPLPAQGLTLEMKQHVSRALLASGATISEMNCVRRHLSAIKGGRLGAACFPAQVLTLLISDVPGDRPVDIASGPTVADPTTSADALNIVRRYGIEAPREVLEHLESGRGESVKPGDPRLKDAKVHTIATPQMALEAAASVARASGVAAHILSDAIEGGSVSRILAITLAELLPSNAFRPVAISYTTAPNAKMSVRASISFCLPSICSGAMYCNVPRIVPSAVAALFIVGSCDSGMTGDTSCFSFAKPKSNSFVPDFVSMTLPGFRSRWVMPVRCALSRASEISIAYCNTCWIGSEPFCSRCASVSPSMYSITKKLTPSCVSKSCTVAMLGWFSLQRICASLRKSLMALESVSALDSSTFNATSRPNRSS